MRNKKSVLTLEAKKVMQELGRLGGKMRAAMLTPEERRASALKASKAAADARSTKASAPRRSKGR
jgi:hypothetical protein